MDFDNCNSRGLCEGEELDANYRLNMTNETNTLRLAANEDKSKRKLTEQFSLHHAVLLSDYHNNDDISGYNKGRPLEMKEKEVNKLKNNDPCYECSRSTLTPRQQPNVGQTRRIFAHKPYPTATSYAELRARCVAKDYSHMATYFITLLMGRLGRIANYQTTASDVRQPLTTFNSNKSSLPLPQP